MLTSMHHDINHYANLYASELTSMHYSSTGLGEKHRGPAGKLLPEIISVLGISRASDPRENGILRNVMLIF